jgi:type VI secretion system protein ImpE
MAEAPQARAAAAPAAATATTMTPADQRFAAGDLDGALSAAQDAVRAKPADLGARSRLFELLCFAGQWERADAQIEAGLALQPDAQTSTSLLRQLVRADMARQQFHAEGRVPEFLTPPPEHVKLRLAASIELREGRASAAADMLARAESMRPAARGTEGANPFDDFRDLDDLLGGILEVLTPTGKYFWIPVETIDTAEFNAPASRMDLLWRPVHMTIRDGGPDGIVYVPALYAGSQRESDVNLRLGRATDWRETPAEPQPIVRGVGLRMFLVGENERDVLSLGSLQFNAGGAAATS